MRKLPGRQFVARTATLLAVLATLAAARLDAQAVPPARAPAKAAAPGPIAAGPTVAAPARAAAPTTDPAWPRNAAPVPAVVEWDSRGLRISAKNASLREILTEVSSRTGATLEGMGADERVFGEYGPGPAKEVLAQVLNGSAYNVMLIGDQGQGTPRQIVLSMRSASGQYAVQPAQTSAADDDSEPVVEDTPMQQPPPIPRPPMNPNPGQPGQPLPPGQTPPPPL